MNHDLIHLWCLLKGLCREQKFIVAITVYISFFYTRGINDLSSNVTTPDTIASVMRIKKIISRA